PSSSVSSTKTRKLADLMTPTPTSTGAFVDLNWLNPQTGPSSAATPWDGAPLYAPWNPSLAMSPFFGQGHRRSQLLANNHAGTSTFDTWSYHYEHDGLDQDKSLGDTSGPDQGTTGFQDNAGNYETSPPYPVPLRGIKVIIRCYEPDSRQ